MGRSEDTASSTARSEPVSDRYEVVVIGAGLGGLSCAAHLAKAGLDVLVLEASDRIGGACHTSVQAGFGFEDGALWLSMGDTCREVFAGLGESFDELVPSLNNDPTTLCLLPDGQRILFRPDADTVETEIGRISERDVGRFRRFMVDTERRNAFLYDGFLNRPFSWSMTVAPRFWASLPFLLMNYRTALYRAFRHHDIRLAFARPVMFLCLPPSQLPAAYMVSSYGEITSGSAYPIGGMGSIPTALFKLANGYGAEIVKSTRVTKILLNDHSACGVVLADGHRIQAAKVVSNVHKQTTYFDLIGRSEMSGMVTRWLEGLDRGLSNIAVQLGLDYKVEAPANSALLPPLDELDAFWRSFRHGMPEVLYPNMAVAPGEAGTSPADGSSISITHAAPLEIEGGWESRKEEIAEHLINTMEGATGISLRGHVVTQRVRTPVDLEKECGLLGGAKYGLAPRLFQSGPFRTGNRSSWFRNLYLVGQTTHPGLGVANAMVSGRTTAGLLLEDL